MHIPYNLHYIMAIQHKSEIINVSKLSDTHTHNQLHAIFQTHKVYQGQIRWRRKTTSSLHNFKNQLKAHFSDESFFFSIHLESGHPWIGTHITVPKKLTEYYHKAYTYLRMTN